MRQAVPADAAAVRELVRVAYQHYISRIGRPPAPMVADYDQLIGAGVVWVVEAGGQLAAVLVLHERDDHVEIENLAVDPVHQGTGIGTELLRFAEERGRANGAREARLYTNEKMTENLAYYPRRGYVESGHQVGDGFSRVYFVKRLTER